MDKKKLIFFITFIVVLVASFYIIDLPRLVDRLENTFYKYLISTNVDNINNDYLKKSDDIMIVFIDDLTTQKIAEHPEFESKRNQWTRGKIAEIINFIEKGQPKAIVVDLLFQGKEGDSSKDKLSDNKLKKSFENSENVLIGLSVYPSKKRFIEIKGNEVSDKEFIQEAKIQSKFLDKKFQLDVDDSKLTNKNLINNLTYYNYVELYKLFVKAVDNLGAVNVITSKLDSTVKSHEPIFKHVTQEGYRYYPSLPLATLLAILPEREKKPFKITNKEIILGKRKIPLDKEGKFLINWHGGKFTYEHLSVYKILFSDAYNKKKIKNIDKNDLIKAEEFKDKIVILGKIISGNDIHTTPLSMGYPGPEVQATCIDNLINDTHPDIKNRKKIVHKANLWQNIAFTLLLLLAIGLYNLKQKESHLILIWSFIWAFILILAVILAFFHFRIWLNLTYPMIAIIALSTYIYVKRINELNTEKKEIEDVFGHYVSPQVLQKVLSDKTVSLTPDKKYLTVIFADIRGFTTLSEKYQANELIPQLNEYFDEMYNIIISHDGTMDKFIGDAVMAFWGDPLPFEDHAKKAVQASKEMMKAVIKLNMKWKREGKPLLKIGIGINTGEMIVGPMGASRMVNYTVFGDSVNLASRIESLNKTYGTGILIGENTYNCIKDETEATYVDEVKVKGKDEAVKIYKII